MKNIDFDRIDQALSEAGVTMKEAAVLYKVSRPTLYNWKNGRPVSNDFIYDCAMAVTARLERAVDQKLLPLADDTDADSRMRLIKERLKAAV